VSGRGFAAARPSPSHGCSRAHRGYLGFPGAGGSLDAEGLCGQQQQQQPPRAAALPSSSSDSPWVQPEELQEEEQELQEDEQLEQQKDEQHEDEQQELQEEAKEEEEEVAEACCIKFGFGDGSSMYLCMSKCKDRCYDEIYTQGLYMATPTKTRHDAMVQAEMAWYRQCEEDEDEFKQEVQPTRWRASAGKYMNRAGTNRQFFKEKYGPGGWWWDTEEGRAKGKSKGKGKGKKDQSSSSAAASEKGGKPEGKGGTAWGKGGGASSESSKGAWERKAMKNSGATSLSFKRFTIAVVIAMNNRCR